ncbi:MAG: hypothetical protein AAF694_22705 [Bacteroidota bacterium]
MKQLNWKFLLVEVLFLVGGLFLAMKVDEWSTNRRLNKRRAIALKNIRLEIERNKEDLETQGDNEEYYEIVVAIAPYLEIEDDQKDIYVEASQTEVQSLRDSFPEGLSFPDSSRATGGRYQYDVEIDVGGFNYVQLGDIAWEATKIGNLIDRIEFECVEDLLALYKMQERFLEHQERYIETLIEEDFTKMFNQFMVLHEFGNVLKETYEETLDSYEKCSGKRFADES